MEGGVVFIGPTEVIAHETSYNITFAGVLMAQFWRDLLLWELFLNDHPEVKTIIELGTYESGMSHYLLIQSVQRGASFFTFDKEDAHALDSPLSKKLGLGDCFFKGDYLIGQAAKERVLDLIGNPANHPLVLFCDGDYKDVEYGMYAPRLSTGDFVVVHDYKKEPGPEVGFLPTDADESITEEIMTRLCDRFESRTRFFRRI